MRSRFLDVYNTANLLKNGGLDFDALPGEPPPFWEIIDAGPGAVPPDNSYAIVKEQVPESELGAPNYLEFALVSDRVTEIRYDFRKKFQEQSAGKVTPPWIKDNPNNPIPEGYLCLESHLIHGIDVTLGFSIRVPQGEVKVDTVFNYDPNPPTEDEVVFYEALASKEWVRPSAVFNVAGRRLSYLSIRLLRVSTGSVQVQIGSFSLARGALVSLPYTGDMAAEARPKGAIIFAFGKYCPPGYEKMEFTPPPRMGRIFPINSTPDESLSVEGNEVHNHSEAEMTMNPELDWPKLDLIPTPHGAAYGVRADDSEEPHLHEVTQAVHVPPSKDVILCRRL